MRLIDAELMENQVKNTYGDIPDLKLGLLRWIAYQPTVDAVPVVRCKDCECWDDDPDTYGADDGPKGKCMRSFEMMLADDFCSRGERKEGADHDT